MARPLRVGVQTICTLGGGCMWIRGPVGSESVFSGAASPPHVDMVGSIGNLLLAISTHTQKKVALFQQYDGKGKSPDSYHLPMSMV